MPTCFRSSCDDNKQTVAVDDNRGTQENGCSHVRCSATEMDAVAARIQRFADNTGTVHGGHAFRSTQSRNVSVTKNISSDLCCCPRVKHLDANKAVHNYSGCPERFGDGRELGCYLVGG